jgi:glycosyltransferase involved in cell wall biosynthesis
MKVLHVVPSFYPAHIYGGPTRSCYELCRNLAKLGCEVRVLTTDANGLDQVLDVDKDHDVRFEEGFSVRYCRRRLRHSVSPTLVRLLRPYIAWAEVVHLHYVYSFPTFPTILECRWADKPLIWTPRGALQRWEHSRRRGLKEVWDRLWYRSADWERLTLHLTSVQERKDTLTRFPELRASVIPNGVDVPADLNPTQSDRELRMLFIGRLDPIKGIENLLQACNLVGHNRGPDWRLTIAGWGKPGYVARIKQQIDELGLHERVTMAGEVLGDAKKKLFEESDIALVPSFTENFGIVVAEALAHGVPVIAGKGTPWSGLEQTGCGLWVENDPQTLADAICRMSRMPMREMGMRGRAWMQAEFSWQSVASQMLDLYRESLGRATGLKPR